MLQWVVRKNPEKCLGGERYVCLFSRKKKDKLATSNIQKKCNDLSIKASKMTTEIFTELSNHYKIVFKKEKEKGEGERDRERKRTCHVKDFNVFYRSWPD